MLTYDEDTVQLWLSNFMADNPDQEGIELEIDEVKGARENENVILKGCCGSEEYIAHKKNILNYTEYLVRLRGLA